MSLEVLLNPPKPATFDPKQHCTHCKYPLVIDEVVRTIAYKAFADGRLKPVCGHTFHAKCINHRYQNPLTKTETKEEYSSGTGRMEKVQVTVDIPPDCPICRELLDPNTFFPTMTLTPGEDTSCTICSYTLNPAVVQAQCGGDRGPHFFHAECFDEIDGKCPTHDGNVVMQDHIDGLTIFKSLGRPRISPPEAPPSAFHPYGAHHVSDSDGLGMPHLHSAAPLLIYSPPAPPTDDDGCCFALSWWQVAAVVLVAISIAAYVANIFFFAGLNPVLGVIGAPAGLVIHALA